MSPKLKLTAAVEAQPDGGVALALYIGKKLVGRTASYKDAAKKDALLKSANMINAAAVGMLEVPKE